MRKSTLPTVQLHSPTLPCSTKYPRAGPIHGASRVPVRTATAIACARNPRGENNSHRSRRCRVDCPFAVPSRTAEIPRSPATRIFTRILVVFGVGSISRWPNPKSDLRNQCATAQPRLCSCALVTQITSKTEGPPGLPSDARLRRLIRFAPHEVRGWRGGPGRGSP